MEVFRNICPSLYSCGHISWRAIRRGQIALVEETSPVLWKIFSTAEPPMGLKTPQTSCMFFGDDLKLQGGSDWLATAFSEGTLLEVTDGSYIRERYTHLCSTAFILECSQGHVRMIGLFSEASLAANAYPGEILCLMVIHLLRFWQWI